MTRNDVIKHLCRTVGLVYGSLKDFTAPSDGFCEDCKEVGNFQHSGITLAFVRQAVIEKLQRDGVVVNASMLATMTAED